MWLYIRELEWDECKRKVQRWFSANRLSFSELFDDISALVLRENWNSSASLAGPSWLYWCLNLYRWVDFLGLVSSHFARHPKMAPHLGCFDWYNLKWDSFASPCLYLSTFHKTLKKYLLYSGWDSSSLGDVWAFTGGVVSITYLVVRATSRHTTDFQVLANLSIHYYFV